MATHIHVQGERAPRLVAFDSDDVARYAAGLMGLDPGSYTLVNTNTGPPTSGPSESIAPFLRVCRPT